MKISVSQYAKSLYEATKDKSHQEIDGIAAGFLKVLEKNNQLKIAKNIINKFGEIYDKENGIVEAQVTSREKLNGDVMTHVSTYVSNKYGGKKVKLHEKVDKSIKGGIIIRIGDEVLDGSINKQLNNLKKALTI